MKRKAKSIGTALLMVCLIAMNFFSIPVANAATDYEVKYETQCDWKCGFMGKITIKNNGSKEIDQWKLEFDWDKNITCISNAKIESKVDNHYVITFLKPNALIKPGKSVTLGVIGNRSSLTQGAWASSEVKWNDQLGSPSNFDLTDIYDKLSIEDKEWQQYYGTKVGQEFQRSFAHGLSYMMSKFPTDEPHRIGYEMIEKNPVEKFIQAKYQNVKIPTRDGLTLKGLFFPVKNAKGTIIMLHGYGSTAIWETAKLKYLLDSGYQILSYNARYWNYWDEPEKCVELMTNEVQDVNSAVNYLKTRLGVDKDKIGIYGFSYGAFKLELYAHMKNDVKVFIFDGGGSVIPTYTPGVTWEMVADDVARICKEEYGDDQSIYENLDIYSPYTSSMSQLKKPALFIHGINDPTPVSEVEAVYNAAAGPKEMYIFPNSGHCDAMYTSDKDDYESKVLNFLDKYLK